MSDTLRKTSEEYARKIEALTNQISDAENNAVSFKAQLADVTAAKEKIDQLVESENTAARPQE